MFHSNITYHPKTKNTVIETVTERDIYQISLCDIVIELKNFIKGNDYDLSHEPYKFGSEYLGEEEILACLHNLCDKENKKDVIDIEFKNPAIKGSYSISISKGKPPYYPKKWYIIATNNRCIDTLQDQMSFLDKIANL